MGEVMNIRDANGRFVPGQSGNPQGRPGLDPEVKEKLVYESPNRLLPGSERRQWFKWGQASQLQGRAT
jgi:hypothetical protein